MYFINFLWVLVSTDSHDDRLFISTVGVCSFRQIAKYFLSMQFICMECFYENFDSSLYHYGSIFKIKAFLIFIVWGYSVLRNWHDQLGVPKCEGAIYKINMRKFPPLVRYVPSAGNSPL